MRRYGLDRFGDMSPMANGEYYEARDVERLEDEHAAAVKELAALRAELVEERGKVAHRGHTQFGYCVPDQARAFLTGSSTAIIVTRQRTDTSVMPLTFTRGPSKFKLPDGKRPQIGARVYVDGVRGFVKAYSKRHDTACIVRLDGAEENIETINWSLTNDTKRNAERRSRINGDGAGRADSGAGVEASGCEAVECVAGG